MAGTRAVLIEYLGMMVKLITEAKLKFKQATTLRLGAFEMAISNYVAYEYFQDRLVHGRKVTSFSLVSNLTVVLGLNINKQGARLNVK